MIDILISIFGIILTILLIVGIHEFGHFIVARALNIKVLKFSIGFGKSLWKWHDSKGTEYVIAAIPLGGYVKMLDENETLVPKKDLHLAFNRQPLKKKTAVVLAGPIFNFIFAFLIYWLIYIIGFNTVAPIIGKVTLNSIAETAGLKPQHEILSVNNKNIKSWSNVVMQLAFKIGNDNSINITAKNLKNSEINKYILNLKNWELSPLHPEILSSLGIEPYEPKILPEIHSILKNSEAFESGLKVKDIILEINNKPIEDWMQAIEIIQNNPASTLSFKIQRDGQVFVTKIKIGEKNNFFRKNEGFLGISPNYEWTKKLIRHIQYGPITALKHSLEDTKDFIYLNFLMIGKMLTGKVSLLSIGGPITIFQSAGNAINIGLFPFLSFLAFLSIAIGVINLLPIPGLDGGHLLFYIIEAIIKRPLSIGVQNLFYHFGLILLMLLLVQGIANDLMRI